LVGFSLRQRVFVLVAMVILIGWGTMVARNMPIDLLPETRPPLVIILTEAGGLATEEVEQLVTHPIEMVLSGMPGVERVRSTTNAGLSNIVVVFHWGTDPYHDRQVVAERLAMVQAQLPEGVVPQLAPMSAATGLIMQVGIYGPDPMALRDYVDWVLRPHLLALEGVAQVYPIGGEVRTLRFTPNPILMFEYGVTLQMVERTLGAYGTNTTGGFSDVHGTEYTVRNIGRTGRLEDMGNLVVAYRQGTPVLISQIGTVDFAPKVKRGDGSFNGKPSVNLEIIRQPQANTVRVADAVTHALSDMQSTAPPGVRLGMVSYNQADMISAAIANVGDILRDAAVIVAIVLIAFLASIRSTVVSLVAIPISLVVSILVFHLMGSTLNTMALGGIAIGLGQLVDDAVVDVENILRRLGENRKRSRPEPVMLVIARASQEVRSGIVYATFIVLLVFVPLFFLPGQEGRIFAPLAAAYIVSIFASLLVSITVTPALASYLFPRMRSLDREHGGRLVHWLKRQNEIALCWVLNRKRIVLAIAGATVLAAVASMPFLPRSFLPEFNEGNVYVVLLLHPDISFARSYTVGHMAEQFLMQVPEVKNVSRRTGRYEGDTEGDPINDNELVMTIRLDHGRSRQQVIDDIRDRLQVFSADLEVMQQLAERTQQEDNGVKGAIVLKIYGNDLRKLRTLGQQTRDRLAQIPGLVDVLVEQQQETPQIRIGIDYARAKLFGITPAAVTGILNSLSDGQVTSHIYDSGRRYDVMIRLADADRTPETLARLRIDTPSGPVPLASFANVQLTAGPNQVLRENGNRRIAVMANTDGSDMGRIVAAIRQVVASTQWPEGYATSLEGDFRQGEEGRMVISLLAPIAILLIFFVLQQRYRSAVIALLIMANIPLAIVGSVAALWISGQDLSLAALIGFIAVTGVAVRNSLLKVSHFINLHLHEGMPIGRDLVIRGCAERLTPVLMTALAAGLGLVPLLLSTDVAGTEILHPVAIAIFGGLISSTLLDTFTTPVLFELFGERALMQVMATDAQLAYETF
jgi:HME family heavy-metal exporter